MLGIEVVFDHLSLPTIMVLRRQRVMRKLAAAKLRSLHPTPPNPAYLGPETPCAESLVAVRPARLTGFDVCLRLCLPSVI